MESQTYLIIVGVALVVAVLLVVKLRTRPWTGPEPVLLPRREPVQPRQLDDVTAGLITELVGRNQKIHAIKAYREATGVGLKEAKDAIDSWNANRYVGHATPAPAPDPTATAVTSDSQSLEVGARAVKKTSGDIQAVKFVRGETGWGLAEAKAYVDGLG